MPQYRLAAETEARRLDAEADLSSATRDRDIQRSTDYVLGVVLFSIALFFGGMSMKLPTRRLRIVLLSFGIAIFNRRRRLDCELSSQLLGVADEAWWIGRV